MARNGRTDSARAEGNPNPERTPDSERTLDPERTPDPKRTPDPERTRVGGAAVLVAAGAFVVAGGLPGVVAAVAVVAGWFLFGGVYAFALGQLGAASLLAGNGPLELVAVEIGLLGVLLASAAAPVRYERGPPSPDSPDTARRSPSSFVRGVPSSLIHGPALLALGWVLAGGALAVAVLRSLVRPSVAGVLLVVAAGVAAYALHRYQLVSLGAAGGRGE